MAASTSTTNNEQPSRALAPSTRALLAGIPEPMIAVRSDGRILFANTAAVDLLRSASNHLVNFCEIAADPGKVKHLLKQWLRSSSPTPASIVLRDNLFPNQSQGATCRLLGARLSVAERNEELIWVRIAPSEGADPRFLALNNKIYELAREINRRRETDEQLKKQNELLRKQTGLLESIARGSGLHGILEALVNTVQEHTSRGAIVSILLVDDERTVLRHAIASGLPEAYTRMIDGLPIDTEIGSCGTAAFTKHSVFVGDMLVHPYWERYRDAAIMSGMRACWSSPIMSDDEVVLGTFALYYREPNPDIMRDFQIVELCAKTAAVAIQRAKSEERRTATEAALHRTETLAAAGRLAATVAHEINNPLESVTNLIYLARTDPQLPNGVREILTTADKEIARVSHIAQRTLGFYRENSSPGPVNLSELIEDVLELYERKMSYKDIRLHTRISADVTAWTAEGEMRQVISNLVANAIDACEEHASIYIRVKSMSSATLNPKARVLVADTGSGVRPDVRSQIFNPFFTTKRDVGTGLGLWISKNITEKHGGTLRFKSSTGPIRHGTVFSLVLPQGSPNATVQLEQSAATRSVCEENCLGS